MEHPEQSGHRKPITSRPDTTQQQDCMSSRGQSTGTAVRNARYPSVGSHPHPRPPLSTAAPPPPPRPRQISPDLRPHVDGLRRELKQRAWHYPSRSPRSTTLALRFPSPTAIFIPLARRCPHFYSSPRLEPHHGTHSSRRYSSAAALLASSVFTLAVTDNWLFLHWEPAFSCLQQRLLFPRLFLLPLRIPNPRSGLLPSQHQPKTLAATPTHGFPRAPRRHLCLRRLRPAPRRALLLRPAPPPRGARTLLCSAPVAISRFRISFLHSAPDRPTHLVVGVRGAAPGRACRTRGWCRRSWPPTRSRRRSRTASTQRKP
jgi:hypothetical protein